MLPIHAMLCVCWMKRWAEVRDWGGLTTSGKSIRPWDVREMFGLDMKSPLASIDVPAVSWGFVAGTIGVTVAEWDVPRMEEANGAILEAVADCSRGHGKAGKRCRSVCAQTNLESLPNIQCRSQGWGCLGAWQVVQKWTLKPLWGLVCMKNHLSFDERWRFQELNNEDDDDDQDLLIQFSSQAGGPYGHSHGVFVPSSYRTNPNPCYDQDCWCAHFWPCRDRFAILGSMSKCHCSFINKYIPSWRRVKSGEKCSSLVHHPSSFAGLADETETRLAGGIVGFSDGMRDPISSGQEALETNSVAFSSKGIFSMIFLIFVIFPGRIISSLKTFGFSCFCTPSSVLDHLDHAAAEISHLRPGFPTFLTLRWGRRLTDLRYWITLESHCCFWRLWNSFISYCEPPKWQDPTHPNLSTLYMVLEVARPHRSIKPDVHLHSGC